VNLNRFVEALKGHTSGKARRFAKLLTEDGDLSGEDITELGDDELDEDGGFGEEEEYLAALNDVISSLDKGRMPRASALAGLHRLKDYLDNMGDADVETEEDEDEEEEVEEEDDDVEEQRAIRGLSRRVARLTEHYRRLNRKPQRRRRR
jgi:hypothetical protein